MKKLTYVLMFVLATCTVSIASNVTLTVMGEADIVGNDLGRAKAQAELRAKWNALEEASQVKVKVATVIHNSEILDEIAKSEISGSVVKYEEIDSGRDGGLYWVKAKVTVKPDEAKELVGKLMKNTTIAVFIPLLIPDKSRTSSIERHEFTEEVIKELINKGFDVVDLSYEIEATEKLTAAINRGDTTSVINIASQFMAGSLLVGTVRVIDKGSNIGYMKVDFSLADGQLEYRLIGDSDTGRKILLSDHFRVRGQGSTLDHAAHNLSENLAKKQGIPVANAVAAKLLGDNTKSIQVELVGDVNLRKFQTFRDNVKNIAWVLNVRENGPNALILDYPEKAYYLAMIINKNTGYKIRDFSDTRIVVQVN